MAPGKLGETAGDAPRENAQGKRPRESAPRDSNVKGRRNLRMRWNLTARLVCLLGLALLASPAGAMQFEQVQISPTEVIIGGRGPVIKGDTVRLEQALAALPPSKRLLALELDSPGGLVAEGVQLAGLIRTHKLTVLIPSNSQCVSACFLLLAASPRRMAASDALVGVHSANENQHETDTSLAVTTLMARETAKDGIPAEIVLKMVDTTPGRVEWLTPADLASMNVAIYDGDPPAATRQPVVASSGPGVAAPASAPSGVPPPQASLTPVAPSSALPSMAPAAPPHSSLAPPSLAPPAAPPAQSGVSPGFAAGRNDRLGWEAWLASLHGPYREGAVFALAQNGLPRSGTCYGPNGTNRGDFTLGCQVARQRLAPVAARISVNPDYAAGWNAANQPIPVAASGEAEYQGAYFCGAQVAHLTLKVLPQAGTAPPKPGWPQSGSAQSGWSQPGATQPGAAQSGAAQSGAAQSGSAQSALPQSALPPPVAANRRAMFSFGPAPTSPDVPRGAFIVEGSIDVQGGAMTLTPVQWVSQPRGYNWLGLSGRSDDGGKTFTGHVTARAACTIFTLKRVGGATATR